MNEQELKGVLGKLSDQAEAIRRKQDIQKKVERIDHWIKALSEKAAEVAALGAVPVVDVGPRIAALEAEKRDLLGFLTPASAEDIRSLVAPAGPSASADAPPHRDTLREQEIAEMTRLLRVMNILDMSEWSVEERWHQYEIWACEWRLCVQRHSSEIVDRCPILREIYKKIRQLMEQESPGLWFIRALDPKASVDCIARMEECLNAKDALAKERQDRSDEERAKEAEHEKGIWDLRTMTREYDGAAPEHKAEAERKLRHAVREAAKHRHLRDEVADTLSHLRALLEAEFAFLWPSDAPPDEPLPARTLSNLEILSRLMRRMKAKTLVGACHGPFESIYKGFPEHDKGRAKRLLQDLCRLGIVREKPTLIGIRVSLEPKMMNAVDHLIEMKPTGIAAVDALAVQDQAAVAP